MNRRWIAAAFAWMVLGGMLGGAPAQAEAADAETALAEAAAKAGEEGKNLILLFDASWCVYCRLTDAMLERPEAAKVIDAHYRILHVRAQERTPEMKAKQLPGADELYARLAPKGTGMPFTVLVAKDGSVISNSIVKDVGNYGFPVTREELDGFEVMMKAGAPSMTKAELKALRKACVETYKAKPGK